MPQTENTTATRHLVFVAVFVLATFLIQATANADGGIALLAVMVPGMWFSLIPVVIIEAYVLKRTLGIEITLAGSASAASNVVSMIAGIPVAAIVMAAIEVNMLDSYQGRVETTGEKVLAAIALAPLLVIGENIPDQDWVAPLSALVLLIPFFFVSWFIEYFIVKRMVPGIEPKTAIRAVRNANVTSYGLLMLIVFSMLVIGLVSQ